MKSNLRRAQAVVNRLEGRLEAILAMMEAAQKMADKLRTEIHDARAIVAWRR